jgi:hypothetical protein
MAKAVPLTLETMKAPQITPQAATPARSPAPAPKAAAKEPAPKVEQVPLQVRIPRTDARAIKIAAAERELSISEFMLACFHAYMKANKA